MTVTLVESASIHSGNWYNSDASSCCYIPGASGYLSAFFGCDANLRVACTDGGDVYIALNGGSCGHSNRELAKGRAPWTVFWGISAHSFSISKVSDLPNGGWELGNMTCDPDPSPGGGTLPGTNAAFAFPGASGLNVGDAGIPGDYRYVGNVKDLESDQATYFNIYVAFPVKNQLSEVNFDTLTASRIQITGSWIPKIFSYFPWGRWIDGQIWSHNRNGGRLSRYNGGWNDVKNREGDFAGSQGFRHNGNDWAVSPRTGKEG